MSGIIEDLRFALRMLMRRPAFTALAVTTLALGIGATTAVFGVANALFLRPLPYPDGERLVEIVEGTPNGWTMPVDYPNFAAWRARARSIENAAIVQGRALNLTGVGQPEQFPSANVSASFFSTLGVKPALGRDFLPEEDRRNGSLTVILSHAIWQARFGADRSVVGRTLRLSGRMHMVVGILPPTVRFHPPADFYVPFEAGAEQIVFQPGSRDNTKVIARCKPGVSPQSLRLELEGFYHELERQSPATNANVHAVVAPLREWIAGSSRKPVLVLLGAVGLLFSIALVNVANLLLARSAERGREMALRSALGAGRGRILRQLLTEAFILSLAGAAAGIVLAAWSVEALSRFVPAAANAGGVAIDARVLGFTLAISGLAAVVFGLTAALHASRVNLAPALRNTSRTATVSRAQRRVGEALVTAEVALALVLLASAGLLMRSFAGLMRVDPGIRTDALTARLNLPLEKYGKQPEFVSFWSQVIQRVRALPGVQDAGFTTSLPLSGSSQRGGFLISGQPDTALRDAAWHAVSPGYFRAIGIPLLRGRYLEESDTEPSAPVAVISRSMGDRYWPGEDPIGRQVHMGPRSVDLPWMTVVGVVGDTRHYGLNTAPEPECYFSAFQLGPWTAPTLVIRTSGDSIAFAPAVRAAVAEVDREQPVVEIKVMRDYLAGSVAARRANMLLLGVFAAAALLLATVGVYGVVSNSVARRTQEIGVRVAFGAVRGDVLRLLVAREMRPTFAGIALGLAASFGLTRVMASMLFGVSPTDGPTLAAVSLLLASVALVASYLPALRATRIDPVSALRCE